MCPCTSVCARFVFFQISGNQAAWAVPKAGFTLDSLKNNPLQI